MKEGEDRVWCVVLAIGTQLLLPLELRWWSKDTAQTQYEEMDNFWSAYSFSVLSPDELLDCEAAKALFLQLRTLTGCVS